MYRIILVDDEPLILAGIASLLNWEDYNCTIVGKATNGTSAYEMILNEQPDIIITDIKMPVLTGLELIEKCKAVGCTFTFVVLTNLEEFHLAKKALSLGAIDYLVKLNLTPETLIITLQKAIETCEQMVARKQHKILAHLLKNNSAQLVHNFFASILKEYDKKSIHSMSILLENPELKSSYFTLNIEQTYTNIFVLFISIYENQILFDSHINQESSYATTQMQDILHGITKRYFSPYCLLEYQNNKLLLIAPFQKFPNTFQQSLTDYCKKLNIALKTYFEFQAIFGISSIKETLEHFFLALQEGEIALKYYYYDASSPIVFYKGQTIHQSKSTNFNINFLKKELFNCMSQNNSAVLQTIFQEMIELFITCKPDKKQATSACINLYIYLYSFFENEEEMYEDIFPYTINIAEQLNKFHSLQNIIDWLQSFCQKLCKLLDDRKNTKSDKLVDMTKQYIQTHYTEKLTLTEIAEKLNISPGYLSSSFKKYTQSTLSDYIAFVKIEHAKQLIEQHQYLMYEVSNLLGFENPYYFSKVFKKVAGISPRDYENQVTKC